MDRKGHIKTTTSMNETERDLSYLITENLKKLGEVKSFSAILDSKSKFLEKIIKWRQFLLRSKRTVL